MSPRFDSRGEPAGKPDAVASRSPNQRRSHLTLVGWMVFVALSVGLLLASIPAHYEALTNFAGADAGPDVLRANLEKAGVSVEFYATYLISTGAAVAAVWVAVGVVILLRRPDDRMAIFTAVTLATCAVFFLNNGPLVLAEEYPVAWLPVRLMAVFGSVSFMAFLYLFPNGRFAPRWTRWLVLFWLAHEAGYYLFPGTVLDVESASPLIDFVLVCTVLLVGLGSQLYRYRRVSGPIGRQQTKWVVFGTASSLLGVIALQLLFFTSPTLLNYGSPYSFVVAAGSDGFTLLIPLSIGAAILRRRLWDIDIVINRALVYGILTAVVVGVYVLVVGGLGSLLQARGNLALSLTATGLVAVLFAPLRERLQRGVNRLMYGERDDPYRVLSRLGRRLGAAIEPGTVLPTIVETVAGALKLPYAAISIRRGERGFEVAAAHGTPTGEETVLPLTYGGETLGQLLLAPRTPGEPFSPADRSLLEDLARNAEVAVYAVRLTDDLQRSRERLVTAGEEERRRLRRDLHDGLGPTLASLTLGLDVSLKLLKKNPDEAEEMLSRLKAQTKEAVVDIRRLVYGLRPPALDDLGLVAAIREQAAAHGRLRGEGEGGSGLGFRIEAPDELPPLPAAVEVACYRIAQEAITNVARHARASLCRVRLSVDPNGRTLGLEVTDDGVGLPDAASRRPGVGLSSMRERAEELGGKLSVAPAPEGGTRVSVVFPLPATAAQKDSETEGPQEEGAPAPVRVPGRTLGA
ncbi:sensor histidine kinase [Rubrobacter tropicus]|uniref:Sensor histidine kinase n=1 Tax=Rubrobacter tropicus TaxID=2653851 RepID=A0A6G8Q5S2_9ACTN|nr:GAF domain-containing sensor histidine kinase [Rubrobacter tropicus]QIN81812.1 sensor histidine kinase [Rubrobacter tropicus]